MINSDFIIRYTNALYSTPAASAPRYDEFRDMFSSGQIRSKEWLVRKLETYVSEYHIESAIIAGAWYGTLGIMLRNKFPELYINMLDIDSRCKDYVNNIIYDMDTVNYLVGDMYTYNYTEDLIINTSCEHIPDVSKWVKTIPENTLVVLQSNNLFGISDHINCVDSEHKLADDSGLKEILHTDSLEMPGYTRYMVIGLT